MTGDGAVIREWMYYGYDGIAVVGSERTVEWDTLNSDTVVDLVRPVEEHNALVAHAHQQAAEIERLTAQGADQWKACCERIEGVEQHAAALHARNAALLKALDSIAANTCCDRCQEAALVAKAALAAAKGETA